MTIRWIERPAVLMAGYVGIYLYVGPWSGGASAPHRTVLQFALVIALACFASRGNRLARALMLASSALGVLLTIFGSTSWWSNEAPAVRLGYFACYTAQLCLLMSAPIYQRTRPGWSRGRPSPARLLPLPRPWMAVGGVIAGVLITLLPFWGLRPFPCPSGTQPRTSCLAHGAGYPIAYRFNLDIVQLNTTGFHWLNVLAPQGIQVIPFTTDVALWGLGVLLAIYLFWLPNERDFDASLLLSPVPSSTST
jgi:hypothetical protein